MRCLLITNPTAGTFRRGRGSAYLEQRLRAAGMEVHPITAPTPGAMVKSLRAVLQHEPRSTRVIVAGGDGTLSAALPALAGTDFPVAVISLGTFNVVAREMGVPLDLEGALAVARDGRPRPVDVGLANGRPFIVNVGVGYDAEVTHRILPGGRKRPASFPRYAVRGLGLLARYRGSRFRIEADGDGLEADAWMAVAANISHYAYHWRVAAHACAHDGCLDLCLFERHSAVRTFAQTAALVRGRHLEQPGVRYLRARRFTITCDPPARAQLDGDIAGGTPLDLRVVPEGLRLLVPEAEV
jgi:diacylglycerol kinase (ATP)